MTDKIVPDKRREAIIILILGALTTVTPFSIDMYLPAFSLLANDFKTTPAIVSLSVTSYFVGIAIGQLLYGPLLDRFGRKKPLYAGLALYVIASITIMFSTTIEMLVVLRFVQAIGGCVAMVAAMTMVRDFFPVEKSVTVFSLLVLILGVSPLLAPTVGGFITVSLGWPAIFVVLSVVAVIILLLSAFILPVGQKPDPTVSLKPAPMLATFTSILQHPQFYTYSVAGALSFATLFIYVAGSPVIFMERFKLSPEVYGLLFALLSVGFIGGSQLNRVFSKRYSSQTIFKYSLVVQVGTAIVFLVGTALGIFGLIATLIMFFIMLACIGLLNPNASALALAPFNKNVGSASALVGFIQLGVAGLASGGVGLFNTSDSLPIISLLTVLAVFALIVLLLGERKMADRLVENASGTQGALH